MILTRTMAALAVAASAMLPALPATAATRHDGTWSVLIITTNGPCDRAYRYAVSIRNGTVVYTGGASVNLAGKVAANGTVRVSVWRGNQRADGSGRLSRSSGGGRWKGKGTSATCSGTWTAERR